MKDKQTAEQAAGARIRDRRAEIGLSQQALAEAMTELGFSWHQTTVAKTEAAERPLRLNEIAALATALSTPATVLIGGDDGLVVRDLGDHLGGLKGKRLRDMIRARSRAAEIREEIQTLRDRIDVLSVEEKNMDAVAEFLKLQLQHEGREVDGER